MKIKGVSSSGLTCTVLYFWLTVFHLFSFQIESLKKKVQQKQLLILQLLEKISFLEGEVRSCFFKLVCLPCHYILCCWAYRWHLIKNMATSWPYKMDWRLTASTENELLTASFSLPLGSPQPRLPLTSDVGSHFSCSRISLASLISFWLILIIAHIICEVFSHAFLSHDSLRSSKQGKSRIVIFVLTNVYFS